MPGPDPLLAAGISAMASPNPRFRLYHRGDCLCFVEAATGQIGAAMTMTAGGPATLLWRDGEAFLAGRGFEEAAAPEQIAAMRQFVADLEAALAPPAKS
jgi:hypothetical protein